MHRVLVIEPALVVREHLKVLLNHGKYETVAVADLPEAARLVHRQGFEAMIMAWQPRDIAHSAFLRSVRAANTGLGVVALLDQRGLAATSSAMAAGADEALEKPYQNEALHACLRRVIKRSMLRERQAQLQKGLKDEMGRRSTMARTPGMRRVLGLLEHAARGDEPVLIVGEAGTGKRVIAQALHELSPRGAYEPSQLDCGTRGSEFEAALYGRAAGAFAGQGDVATSGRLADARGSTLLLSNLEALAPEAQLKLATVLETRKFEQLAGNESHPCDARFVGLATPEIDQALQGKRFRHDLYCRFATVRIDIPPLRLRPQDIPALAMHFLDRYRGMSTPPVTAIGPLAMRSLLCYVWPGNARELENVIRGAVARASGQVIERAALPPHISGCDFPKAGNDDGLIDLSRSMTEVGDGFVERVERSYLSQVLQRYHGQVTAASKHAGMSRRGLTEKVKRLGMTPNDFSDPFLFEEMKSALAR